MWGELSGHKRSLTHHPGSQGWGILCHAPVCVCVEHVYMYVHNNMLGCASGLCGAGLVPGAGVGM